MLTHPICGTLLQQSSEANTPCLWVPFKREALNPRILFPSKRDSVPHLAMSLVPKSSHFGRHPFSCSSSFAAKSSASRGSQPQGPLKPFRSDPGELQLGVELAFTNGQTKGILASLLYGTRREEAAVPRAILFVPT